VPVSTSIPAESVDESQPAEERLRQLIRAVDDAEAEGRAIRPGIGAVLHALLNEFKGLLLESAEPLIGCSDHSPEDALQDALTRFASALQERALRQRLLDGRPVAFVRRMVRNRSLDLLKSRRRRDELAQRLSTQPQTRAVEPDVRLLADESRRRVDRLLKPLTEDDAVLLELFCVQGLSSAEVAARTGRSSAGVRKRVSRLLAQLREQGRGFGGQSE
jgi:RNA polymerase sigma factor (sigma-70 family)